MAGNDYLGGSVPQMRDLGGKLVQGAGAVQGLIQSISSKVSGVKWTGQVAEDFKADWNGNFSPALGAAADEMDAQGRRLLEHANLQDQHSNLGR